MAEDSVRFNDVNEIQNLLRRLSNRGSISLGSIARALTSDIDITSVKNFLTALKDIEDNRVRNAAIDPY